MIFDINGILNRNNNPFSLLIRSMKNWRICGILEPDGRYLQSSYYRRWALQQCPLLCNPLSKVPRDVPYQMILTNFIETRSTDQKKVLCRFLHFEGDIHNVIIHLNLFAANNHPLYFSAVMPAVDEVSHPSKVIDRISRR